MMNLHPKFWDFEPATQCPRSGVTCPVDSAESDASPHFRLAVNVRIGYTFPTSRRGLLAADRGPYSLPSSHARMNQLLSRSWHLCFIAVLGFLTAVGTFVVPVHGQPPQPVKPGPALLTNEKPKEKSLADRLRSPYEAERPLADKLR